MSTIKTSNIQNGSSSSVNIALNTDGSATFAQMPVGPSYFAMRNKIINGAMILDQRNASQSVTIGATAGTYTLDRWGAQSVNASKFSIQQNAGSVTPPAGFINYLGITSLAATSAGSSDYYSLYQPIEGLNVADLAWGTANAKTVTVSFWVYSSLTGTFSGSLANSGASRSYPFSYTISSANTWEYKTITVAGDTTGTWLTSTGIGVYIRFDLGCGSSFRGTANTWAGANYYGVTSSVSVVGTNGATFYLTGVQFEVGSVATPFEQRLFGAELQLAQRYYEKSHLPAVIPGTDNLSVDQTGAYVIYGDGGAAFSWRVEKRTQPTITVQAPLTTSSTNKIRQASNGTILTVTGTAVYGNVGTLSASGASNAYYYQLGWTASSEL